MKKSTIWILIVVIAIIAIGVVAFKGGSKPQALTTITVADPRAIGWAPFHIALEKKYFEEKGLDVKDIVVQTGDESLKASLSGSADIALAGIIPYSFVALDHPEMKIVAQNAYVHDTQITANKEKGINKPEDLKGKKIGYAKTTASDIEVDTFLKTHNIKASEVTLINMKPLAAPAALAGGEIDAYSGWEPHTTNIRKLLGDKAITFDSPQDTYTWHASVIAKEDYIKNHKDELERFVKAWQKAEQFMKDNPDEATAIAAKYGNIPAETVKGFWSKYEFKIGITDDTFAILKTDLAWANTRRETPVTTLPDAQQLVDTSIVNYEK